ncbi:alpha/beta fold hydrolase [Bifidobacterium sp. ESL0745]|uniref:alpha/beta fold hydrolase n=1 Tax=Bifidobacterium sp. ESL0745 TaxID=2983226 RepID=UPI0023F842F6|nr:alpha/beta fold hydrolase [Bifidobacterium sp. ESL0745]MDF7665920.1 hypothetical protein [Bifidobacterium sp. ESL0745]
MFHKLTGNRQFDLQINRFAPGYDTDPEVKHDVDSIVPDLTSTENWTRAWEGLASVRELKGDYAIASGYYAAAAFYVSQVNDFQRKDKLVRHFREDFYKGWEGPDLDRREIPYEDTLLPAVRVNGNDSEKTLVVFGGFDSYLEELVKWTKPIQDAGYTVIMFDGPGQGNSLLRGTHLTPAWERPTGCVMDYFNVKHTAAMGISLGGLLVLRAAAFDKRIDQTISMDIFYRALDGITIRMSEPVATAFLKLVKRHDSKAIDRLVDEATKKDIDIAWKLQQGCLLTGTKTPHDMLYAFERFDFSGLGPLINQDVLLLAGEHDQYVPLSRLSQIENELVNAASIASRVYTAEENADEHCQVGNMPLAMNEIRNYLTKSEQ